MQIRTWLTVGLAAALGLTLTSCSQPDEKPAEPAPSSAAQTTEASAAPSQSEKSAYPVEVKSCDETLTFEKAPERVFIFSEVNSAILYELGVLDHVKYRAGDEKLGEGQKELKDALSGVQKVESSELDTGGATLSTEAILAVNPDLVIAYDTGVDREGLRAAGVPMYAPDAMCPNYSVAKADWSLLDKEIDKMAAIFGVSEKAEEVKKAQAEKIAGLAGGEVKADAAALYVTPGSDEFYTYGSSSMVQPIFAANGLKNVYDDETTRVFDVSMEDLLRRDPEWIVLLAGDAEGAEEAKKTFLGFNGASGLKAVKKEQVVFLPFVLTDPPSTLSVDGAIELGKQVK